MPATLDAPFRMVDAPVRLSLEEYAWARRWLAAYAARRPDIAAVLEYGSVGAPGLSDLDVIIVLAKQPCSDIARYLDRDRLPQRLRAVLGGATLMVMSEEDAPHIARWDDVQLTQRHGAPIPIHPLAEQVRHYTEGCRLVDWLPWHAARLTRLLISRELPLRRTAGLLYSLRYSLARLRGTFGVARERWMAFEDQVSALRASWFVEEAASRRTLAGLVEAGHRIAGEALDAAGELFAEDGWYGRPDGEAGALEVPGGTRLRFTNRSSGDRAAQMLADSSAEQVVVELPSVFLRHFAAYALGRGPISCALRGALTPAVDAETLSLVAPGLVTALRERMELCDRWASFLSDQGVASGLFKFAWFYRAPCEAEGRVP